MALAIHQATGAVPLWRIHDSDDDCARLGSGVDAGLICDGPRARQEGIDAEAAARLIEGDFAEGLVAENDAGRAEGLRTQEGRLTNHEGAENHNRQGDGGAEDDLDAPDQGGQG